MSNVETGLKTFNPLNVSSKFAICGLPLRVDTYKNCTFGCKYCFSNSRVICEFGKQFQVADLKQVERKLKKVREKGADKNNFLETLIEQDITWHCGGMSDPFQPAEKVFKVTEGLVDICNEHNVSILFSTKSDTVYGANIRPDLHTFQLSITNTDNRQDLEPNVPDIEKRLSFYKRLKAEGFKVGVRIQPFIPGVTNIDIVDMFEDADNFTLEGIKIVPQNKEHKEYILGFLGMDKSCFTQMGLLNLKPDIRLAMYKPFIERFEEKGIPYSIADNDLHYIGTNECCCGDRLVKKSTAFNNTTMLMRYGQGYAKEQIDDELAWSGCRDCKCNQLFTSNRQEGCVTVQDFFDKRFYRKSSPFSPRFQYYVDGVEGMTNE
jgi:DNA repair photolyase